VNNIITASRDNYILDLFNYEVRKEKSFMILKNSEINEVNNVLILLISENYKYRRR
jgi:hypothetical protein